MVVDKVFVRTRMIVQCVLFIIRCNWLTQKQTNKEKIERKNSQFISLWNLCEVFRKKPTLTTVYTLDWREENTSKKYKKIDDDYNPISVYVNILNKINHTFNYRTYW